MALTAGTRPLALLVGLLALPALGLGIDPLEAQDPIRVIRGTVFEEATGEPIEGASLVLLNSRDIETGSEAVSGPAGQFILVASEIGIHSIRVRRLGYGLTFTPPFEVPESGPVSVRVLLTQQPIEIDALNIPGSQIDWVRRGYLREFYARVDQGSGRYLTRDDLARFPASKFTDLVHMIPGFSTRRVGTQDLILSQRSGRLPTTLHIRSPLSRLGAADGRQQEILDGQIERGERDFDLANACPVLFYVDGRPLNPGNNPSYESVEMAYILDSEDIEGVEFYSGPSSVPGEFSGTDAGCGVVVIWTRRSSYEVGRGGGAPH